MPRRREVLAVVMATTVAGCGGLTDTGGSGPDDPDGDDDADDPADTESPEGGGEPADGSTPDSPTGTDQMGLGVTTDFDSYAMDTEIRQEQEGSETLIHDSHTEWDLENDRAYRRYELREGGQAEGEGLISELYVIEDTTYQIQMDRCSTFSVDLVNPDQISGIAVPTSSQLETAESIEHVATETIDGERAEVWRYDLAESMNIIEGEMRFYVSVDTGYLLRMEGSYEVGAHDNPTVITFTRHHHSFDEAFDIEVPADCEE